MLWESALGSVIEVAISLAGFSGIVAAVGRRGVGQWSTVEQLLLRILLGSSGATLFFAFLPFTLIEILEPSIVWRALSGALALWFLGIYIVRSRQSAVLGITQRSGLRNPFFMIGALAVISLLVANAFWLALPSLYVVGVLWGVAISFAAFVILLLNSWRHIPDSTPETD